MKILFSPIGNTDPIKYSHDGSMLHICRFYLPDVVYMYMSKEILESHRKDNRFVWTLEQLGIKLNYHFEVKVIERPDLVDATDYDYFYMDFTKQIQEIRESMNPEDKLYINMASGTPAMKSALLVIATLAEYSFTPIKVLSPQGKSNQEMEDRREYDVKSNWDLDEDDQDGCENRCVEEKCQHLIRLLKIEEIKKHIESYDYYAAYTIAKDIKSEISEESFKMLCVAKNRAILNDREAHQIDPMDEFGFYPIADGDKRTIFEYALLLDVRIKRGEYGDFIRAITPIVVDILEIILEKTCKIKVDDLCFTKDGVRKWDKNKLCKNELYDILNEAYSKTFKCGPVYSTHLQKLICSKSEDEELNQKVSDIIHVERYVRNRAAHEIVSVTEEWIKKETGKSAKDIFELIKYLIVKCDFAVKSKDWDSYDEMNAKIEAALDKGIED